MSGERRYDDDEVADIFQAAASASAGVPARSRTASGGLTLAELQAIGREVGIPADRIAAAASSLDRRGALVTRRTTLGMPVSVGRTVDLPRALTDHEWAQLVAELRETFRARGREGSDASGRQWTNGNLHAFVEPTPAGYRLRLGTLKGDAVALNRLGFGAIMVAAILFLAMLVAGEPAGEFAGALMIGAFGAAAVGFNALRLPRWASEREQQMDHIVERARALLEGAAAPVID